jgi:hypothetical protein
MGGCAKPIEAKPHCIICHPQGAVANQPSTKKGSRLKIGIARWDGETKAFISDGVFGIATVHLIARKPSLIAQVLPLRSTVVTMVTGSSQPGNPNAIAQRKLGNSFPQSSNSSHNLMPQHQGQFGMGQLTIQDM